MYMVQDNLYLTHIQVFLSIFSTRILNGNPINIFEDGLESRDFVFIDDVVDATIVGLESKKR